MKNTHTLLITCLFFMISYHLNAQVYVKSDATGANNGTSWTDAYSDLSMALDSSIAGSQIWVATGTYKPGGAVPAVADFFALPHDLELYGGFVGTETMLSDRDPAANITKLSGDHNDDDVANDFTTNRAENANHIMWLTDTITNATIIDGFSFLNGTTMGGTASGNDRRGGAILSYGAPIIRNCIFDQNYGYFGGAVYPRQGAASGTKIENCTFNNNGGQFGASIYFATATGLELTNCDFAGNIAQGGAGGVFIGSSEVLIDGCSFLDNEVADGRGGAIYSSNSSYTLSGSNFSGNVSTTNVAGGIYNTSSGTPSTISITGTSFSQNTGAFGGAIGNFSEGTSVAIEDCTFLGNVAGTSGGGILNAFKASVEVTNSTFETNSARFGAGIYNQNDSTELNIYSSDFTSNFTSENTNSNSGGAINYSGSMVSEVKDCKFEDNKAGVGAAIHQSEGDADVSRILLENNYFLANLADFQGGAVNINNADAEIVNCLFFSNVSLDAMGIGGALSINAADSNAVFVSIMSSTIANNLGTVGAGISQYTDGIGTSELTLQNTILDNPLGTNYVIEAGTPTVVSNGGNLCSDASLVNELVNTNDINSMSPEFVDINYGDLHLLMTSPCINKGVDTGAPTLDLEGNARVGNLDMGAFEFQGFVGNVDLVIPEDQILVYPNPVRENLQFTIVNDWKGKLSVKVSDVKGVEIQTNETTKERQEFSHEMTVEDLPAGVYMLHLEQYNQVISTLFYKE